MLSRRNVRIKILQILYSAEFGDGMNHAEVIAAYRKSLDQSFDLYLYALYVFIKIAEVSKEDQTNRQNKHLPSEEDKQFTSRLYDNPHMQSLVTNEHLQERFIQLKFLSKIDLDVVRQLYKKYMKEPQYLAYATNAVDQVTDLDALLDLFRFVRKHELFEDIMEDQFYSWIDDKSLVIGTIKKTLKQLPDHENFFEAYRPENETTEDFGMKLLLSVLEKNDEVIAIIKPKLENWDIDRLATLDIIILKMAICELISFPTIPSKASINEYLEIAKNYSTDKSKEFVNGVIDNSMRSLISDGVIVKKGRGLK